MPSCNRCIAAFFCAPTRCCELSRAPAAVDAALMAICHMAASPALQQLLLEVGALPYLIPLLLEYDVTLSPETSARLQLPFSGPAGVSSSAGAAAGQGQQVGGGLEGGFKLLDSALVRPNMQEARSQHALLAAQALARLAGGFWLPKEFAGWCCYTAKHAEGTQPACAAGGTGAGTASRWVGTHVALPGCGRCAVAGRCCFTASQLISCNHCAS